MIRDLAELPELRLAAVQDSLPERAAEVAERYGSPWQRSSYEALLAEPGVDVVVISSPNALHVPQSRAALLAGKHVLVQKPLALSAQDARQVMGLANESGRLLFVDYTYRFIPTVAELRRALPEIGRVRKVAARFHNIYGPGKGWFYDRALSGGGALIDLGVHLLDLAIELLGPEAVQLLKAELSHERGFAVEDAARLELRLGNAPFTLEVSWNAPLAQTEIALELEGDSGLLRWENVDGSFFRFRTLRDAACLLEVETTLRVDTLRALITALANNLAPRVHVSVYDTLAAAYD